MIAPLHGAENVRVVGKMWCLPATPLSDLLTAMETLAKHIIERLVTKKSCTVFETELARFFPMRSRAMRQLDAAIQEFARERGLSAEIRDPGIRVKFRKLVD